MYKFFIYQINQYSQEYESQTVCTDMAKLISAMRQCHTAVIDMTTGEIMNMFYDGLKVTNLCE